MFLLCSSSVFVVVSYTMKSATVRIENSRGKEFLNITLVDGPLSVRV